MNEVLLSKSIQKSDAPLSFLEWKRQTLVLEESETKQQYDLYLVEWFNNARENSISINQKYLLRQKYLYMMSQLQMFFTEEEKQEWYSKVNLANETELLLAIPFFAKKLKNIALYYQNFRKKLPNTKIKQNLVGSNFGLEHEIQQYILDILTTLKEELNPVLRRSLPDINIVRESLAVEIEELYDDTYYLDRSPSVPLSSYFDLFDPVTTELFKTKGLTLSSDEWIFNSFTVPVTSNLETFVSNITSEIFEKTDLVLYQAFLEKYIAENKVTTAYYTPSSTKVVTEIPIVAGNNFFHYPYIQLNESAKTDIFIPQIPLSSMSIVGATPGLTIEESDVMHVKYGSTVKTAWLYNKIYEPSSETMEARLNKAETTTFIFPFPGYGLSAEDVPWTGRSLSATPEYKFLSKQNRAAVKNAYWTEMLSSDSIVKIPINKSKLAESGAYSSQYSTVADTIYVNEEIPANIDSPLVPNLSAAWLFRFEETSFPISPSLVEQTHVWPFHYISKDDAYPQPLRDINFNICCEPIPINQLFDSFFVAGSSFETSDKIYKLRNYADESEVAIECCWLSGAENITDNYKWVSQNGFSALFKPGKATRFIWTGANQTPLSSVFTSLTHSDSCTFSTQPSSTLLPEQCTCKQIYYSPYGHPGKVFVDYNSQADFIVEDVSKTLEPFTLGSWLDETSSDTIYTTPKFSWYKTNYATGWGDGKWIGNSNKLPLKLETGKSYFYYRTSSRVEPTSADPSYVINVAHNFQDKRTKWIQAKQDETGEWISAETPANFTLYAGDFITWDRNSSVTHCLISSTPVENTSYSTESNPWTPLDVIALSSSANNIFLSWPVDLPFKKITSYNIYDNTTGWYENDIYHPPVYSQTEYKNISAITCWNIQHNQSGTVYQIFNTEAPSFTPTLTGTYTVTVTAVDVNDNKIIFTNIPSISVIPQFGSEPLYLEFKQPVAGFVMEQPLSGWNYDTNTYDGKSQGARPYWATKFLDKNSSTNFNGKFDSGFLDKYVDLYLPDSLPEISNILLGYGNVIRYERKDNKTLLWVQPIEFNTFTNVPIWCEVKELSTQPSLASLYKIKNLNSKDVIPTLNPTDIVLSNYVEGNPVEITYVALNDFTWSVETDRITGISVEQLSQTSINANQPWLNTPNKFYPTIATVPLASKLYSKKDVGGDFTPKNIGASKFLGKNFTVKLSGIPNNGTEILMSEKGFPGGRGFTQQTQQTPFIWEDDCEWMKEPSHSFGLAGTVKQTLTNNFQTFIPYQETKNYVGLLTPDNINSPWGGKQKDEWVDLNNYPKGFTEVPNVSSWYSSQILNQYEKQMDCWVTDIFGNQYGVFKTVNDTVKINNDLTGELWLKTNNNTILPSYKALSGLYEHFKTIDSVLYYQLTGTGIKSFDCFKDVLVFETPKAVVVAKVDYDYSTENITSSLDNMRVISLSSNNPSQTCKFGQLWYQPDKNIINILTTTVSSTFIIPELYQIKTTTMNLIKVFPENEIQQTDIINQLNSISATNIESGLLTYNKYLYKYLITLKGTKQNNEPFILNLTLQDENS